MNLELGGGTRPCGAGWLNVDLVDSADIHHDLDVYPWPFDDESVAAVYTSHCLEHLQEPFKALWEICRICALGAPVEIRVPHPASHLAMTYGHRHVFSPLQAINIDQHFVRESWPGPKRLKLDHVNYCPTLLLQEAKSELPFLAGLSDEIIQKWIPGTCHECRFHYHVVPNQTA